MQEIWRTIYIFIYYIFLYISNKLQALDLYTIKNIKQITTFNYNYTNELFMIMSIQYIQKIQDEFFQNINMPLNTYDSITKRYNTIQFQNRLIQKQLINIENQLKQLITLKQSKIWKNLTTEINENIEALSIIEITKTINKII